MQNTKNPTLNDTQADTNIHASGPINVLFFASLRERLGCAQLQIDISEPISGRALKETLVKQGNKFDALSQYDVLMAINHEICSLDNMVKPHDEVAFFPPVTGG